MNKQITQNFLVIVDSVDRHDLEVKKSYSIRVGAINEEDAIEKAKSYFKRDNLPVFSTRIVILNFKKELLNL
jgi:hypothetical protein